MGWKRYFDRMMTRPERPRRGKRRIACVGDSITFGAGVGKTRKTDAWPYVWQRELGEDFQVLNYGVCSATVQREGDFPYHRFGFLSRLKVSKPELIVLMLGTNDTKPCNWNEARFARELEELVRELAALPWPHRVALMTPPKAFPEGNSGVIAYDIDNAPIRDIIRPLVASLGERFALPVVDLYALTEEHPEYFADGVHPNAPGNRIIAETICRELSL